MLGTETSEYDNWNAIAMTPCGQPITRLYRENIQCIVMALKAAHEAGVLHRDLKPEHLMHVPANLGASYDWDGLIIDWGVAIHTSDHQYGGLFGTIEYAAVSTLHHVMNRTNQSIRYSKQTDMESLLMCFVVMIHAQFLNDLKARKGKCLDESGEMNRPKFAQLLFTFWSDILSRPPCDAALTAARRTPTPDYDGFCHALQNTAFVVPKNI